MDRIAVAGELTEASKREAGRLTGRIVPQPKLDARERLAMFDLLSTSFVGVDLGTFEGDLAQKNWAILLEDDGGQLRGFSTLLVYRSGVGSDLDFLVGGNPVSPTRKSRSDPMTVVYSGDTIVDRAWWGSSALPLTWLRAVRELAPSQAGEAIYWLLLTSGYRTYRFLPVFFREYYPRVDSEPAAKSLLDTLAGEQFGDLYDPSRGIVRFTRPQVLVPELLDVPQGRARDRHVSFFLDRNPGYVCGDELACLTRIDDDNLTPAGRRMARTLGLGL
jgi:hypothetical protein